MAEARTLTANRDALAPSLENEPVPVRKPRTVISNIAAAAPATAAPPAWNLTPQQWRVFLLVGRALSNKAIAHELNVAESTVKAHISAIFKVSGCRNRTEAALLSLRVRYGLLEPDQESGASLSALDDLRRVNKIARVK